MKMNKKAQFGQAQGILSNFTILIIFLVVVAVAGLLAGVLYFDMNILQSTIQTVNFQIPIQDNSTVSQTGNITSFQDIMNITIYPLLGLKSALPYLTYFLVFALIIALAVTAYVSSKNPVFFVLHILFTILISLSLIHI